MHEAGALPALGGLDEPGDERPDELVVVVMVAGVAVGVQLGAYLGGHVADVFVRCSQVHPLALG
jgi:hypothetical protein